MYILLKMKDFFNITIDKNLLIRFKVFIECM